MFKLKTTALFSAFCCMILQFITTLASGQTKTSGIIEGRVLKADGSPQENVIIILSPLAKQTISNDNGTFEFRNIPYGNYTIAVKSLGLSTQSISVALNSEKVTISNIQLLENAQVLNRVIVNSSYRHINKNSSQVARMPLTYLENPQSYAVIPKELLYTQLATTTEQALLNIPGLSNIATVGGSGGASLTFKSRGFSNGSVILRNGVSSGYVTLTDLFNVERIEAIKGPSSTLFGGNQGASYGGVYNMLTKKPLEVTRGEISFTTGSYEMARTTIDYNTPLNDDKTALLRLNGVYDSRNSFQNLGQNTVGLAPSLLIKATDKLTLSFDGYFYKTSRPTVLLGIGAMGFSNFDSLHLDPKNAYFAGDIDSKQQTTWISGQAEYKLSEKWVSQTVFSVSRSNNNTPYVVLRAARAANATTTSINRSILDIPFSQLYTQQFQQNFTGDFKLGSMRNRLLIGVDYFRTNVASSRATLPYDNITINTAGAQLLINRYRVDSIGKTGAYSNSRSVSNSYGAYVSEVLNLTSNLLVMASLRVNRFNADGYMQTAYSPKLGISYMFIPTMSVFGNYTNGYNNASSGTDSLGNILKPEYANQWEGGVKFDLFQNRLTGTVSVYDIKVKNIARQIPSTINYVQDNTVKSRGLDVDILATPVTGLNIALGYGYNDIRYTEDRNKTGFLHNRVESAPYHSGNLWATYQLASGSLQGFGLGFGGNGQSSSFTDNLNKITLNGYSVYGASIFYNALKFRITAKVDNIGNKMYYTYNSWLMPGQPRMLSFNATYRF